MSFTRVEQMMSVPCNKCGSARTCGLELPEYGFMVLNEKVKASNGYGNWKGTPNEIGIYGDYLFFCIDCKTIQNDLSTMDEKNKSIEDSSSDDESNHDSIWDSSDSDSDSDDDEKEDDKRKLKSDDSCQKKPKLW